MKNVRSVPTPSNGRPRALPPSSYGTSRGGFTTDGNTLTFFFVFMLIGLMIGTIGTHMYLTRTSRVLVGQHVTNGLCEGYIVQKNSGYAEVRPWTCKGMELSYANVDYEELEPVK
jgi:hypothetical protein